MSGVCTRCGPSGGFDVGAVTDARPGALTQQTADLFGAQACLDGLLRHHDTFLGSADGGEKGQHGATLPRLGEVVEQLSTGRTPRRSDLVLDGAVINSLTGGTAPAPAGGHDSAAAARSKIGGAVAIATARPNIYRAVEAGCRVRGPRRPRGRPRRWTGRWEPARRSGGRGARGRPSGGRWTRRRCGRRGPGRRDGLRRRVPLAHAHAFPPAAATVGARRRGPDPAHRRDRDCPGRGADTRATVATPGWPGVGCWPLGRTRPRAALPEAAVVTRR